MTTNNNDPYSKLNSLLEGPSDMGQDIGGVPGTQVDPYSRLNSIIGSDDSIQTTTNESDVKDYKLSPEEFDAKYSQPLAKAAGGMRQGSKDALSKIRYDALTTLAAFGESAGILSSSQAKQVLSTEKQRLDKIEQEATTQGNLDPEAYREGRDIAAFWGEALPTTVLGGAAQGIVGAGGAFSRLAGSALGGAVSGALQSSLGAEYGTKGQAAALGGALGGTVGLAGQGIAEGIRLGVGLGGKGLDKVKESISKTGKLTESTGIDDLTLTQKAGMEAPLRAQQKQALKEALPENLNKLDLDKLEKGFSEAYAGKLKGAYKEAEVLHSSEANKLYEEWLGPRNSAFRKYKITGANTKQVLESELENIKDLGIGKNLAKKLEQVYGSPGTEVEKLYGLQQQLGKTRELIRNKKISSTPADDVDAIESISKILKGVQDDLQGVSNYFDRGKALDTAKNYWKENVTPFKNAGIDITRGENPVKQIVSLFKNGDNPVATKVLEKGGPRLQQAAKEYLIVDALEGSLSKSNMLDPVKAAATYKEVLNRYGLIFKPEDGLRIKNVVDLNRQIAQEGVGKGLNLRDGPDLVAPIIKALKLARDTSIGQQVIHTILKTNPGGKLAELGRATLRQLANIGQTGTVGNIVQNKVERPNVPLVSQIQDTDIKTTNTERRIEK